MLSDAHDEIGYGRLVQEALRGVVRGVLQRAALEGLPGAHHFYITFRTSAEGVVLPARLAAQFQDELTLVLQHQFWNLEVDERAFSVTLRFDGQPERLTVPFAALTSFADPSVELALRFASDHEPVGKQRPEGELRLVASAPAPAAEGAIETGQNKIVDLAAFKQPRRRPRPAD